MLHHKSFNWTPVLGYIVGLITTDGSLSKDKRHICFTSTDYDLLVIFRRCLKLKASIRPNPKGGLSKKDAHRIQFGDVVFYQWLNSIGLYNNKSLTVGDLSVPDSVLPDFLRGHLDGDGSIIHYMDTYLTDRNPTYIYDRLFLYFRSASEKHMIWLREMIRRLYGFQGSLRKTKSKLQKGNSSMFELKFSTKEAISLLKIMYYRNGLPCLNRKYLVARPYIV